MQRVEPQIKSAFVADGSVSLAFRPMLDHAAPSELTTHAAECAGRQSPLDFWRMHDAIFANQSLFWGADPAAATQVAAEVGLDMAEFESCMADTTVREKILRLDQERRQENIRIRPTFQVNDQRIQGGLPYEQFAVVLNQLLGR